MFNLLSPATAGKHSPLEKLPLASVPLPRVLQWAPAEQAHSKWQQLAGRVSIFKCFQELHKVNQNGFWLAGQLPFTKDKCLPADYVNNRLHRLLSNHTAVAAKEKPRHKLTCIATTPQSSRP